MKGAPAMWTWVAGVLSVALAGVALDASQARQPASLQEAVRPYLPPPSPDRPIQAAVVLQLEDCDRNLRILDLLHRSNVRDRISIAVIWYTGAESDSAAIRTKLPRWAQGKPIHLLPSTAHEALIRLGHTSPPMLIVLDQYARIRLTSQSPRSSREVAGLIRIIEGLTWIEEL